jgi:hypothetical protein
MGGGPQGPPPSFVFPTKPLRGFAGTPALVPLLLG